MPEKYQNEIEEILKGIEEAGKPVPPPARANQPPPEDRPGPTVQQRGVVPSRTALRWQSVTPGRVALAGLAMLALGLLLYSMGWGSWLIWVGLLGLAAAYLLFFVRPRPQNREKRWRGRPVESAGPSLLQRLRQWIKE